MSCWHDDHGLLMKHFETHNVGPATALMRKHLQDIEESLDLDRTQSSAFDLRAIYAPMLGET